MNVSDDMRAFLEGLKDLAEDFRASVAFSPDGSFTVTVFGDDSLQGVQVVDGLVTVGGLNVEDV